MATVPMLAPDGTSGEIPQEKVQDALKAGFKQAVEMTSPDGKAGYIPADKQQEALTAGFKLPTPPADTRSLWQKAKDNFNANTQGAKPGDGAIKSFVENVGQAGGNVVRSTADMLAHPLDQAHSEVDAVRSAVAHPLDTANPALNQAHLEVNAARENPSKFIANAVGSIGTGAIVGELGGAALGAGIRGIAAIPDAAGNLMSKFPTRAHAGEIFNKLNTQLADQPVQLTSAAVPLQRATEIAARGGTMPASVNALLVRSQAIEPMTFPEARDYQASLSDLSASDKLAMNGRMKGAVAQLNKALYQDIRQAAESGGGMGQDFDKAMAEYRQASQIRNAAKTTLKYGVRAAAGAVGAGALYKIGQELK